MGLTLHPLTGSNSIRLVFQVDSSPAAASSRSSGRAGPWRRRRPFGRKRDARSPAAACTTACAETPCAWSRSAIVISKSRSYARQQTRRWLGQSVACSSSRKHVKKCILEAVASGAICKWGRKIFDVPPHFSLVLPTWGGTTIVCYRLRDNWSGEVWRGAIKVMVPSTYSYTHTHSISSAPITGRSWVHYK